MTVTEAPPTTQKIDVENPATGQIVASIAVVGPEEIPELVERARAAQPGWEALGFEGRAQLFRRCQKWVIDNSERVIETIVSETGKAWEEAQLGRVRATRPPRSASGPRTRATTWPTSASRRRRRSSRDAS